MLTLSEKAMQGWQENGQFLFKGRIAGNAF